MASCGFAHLSGGPSGSSADNPANVQCVVVGSCAKNTQGHLRNFNFQRSKGAFLWGDLDQDW